MSIPADSPSSKLAVRMYLDEVADEIRPGDVLLFRGAFLHSRLIQRFTRSVYSHVGIIHRPTTAGIETLDVLEAKEGSGVQSFPLARYLERGDLVDWFRMTDDNIDRDAVVRWAWERRGARYASWRQFGRSFFYLPLCELLRLDTKIDRDRWFCSFFVSEALAAGGWQPAADDFLEHHQTDPGAVARFTCLQRMGPLKLRKVKQHGT